MNRLPTLATWLVHLLAVVVLSSATGCTLIGYAIGSAADSPGPSGARVVEEPTAGGEDEWNWGQSGHWHIPEQPRQVVVAGPVRNRRDMGSSGGAVGALIGAAIDFAGIIALAVYLGSGVGNGSSPSGCTTTVCDGGFICWCG